MGKKLSCGTLLIWDIYKEAFLALSLRFFVTHYFKKQVNCCKPEEHIIFGVAYPKDRERRHRAHGILQGLHALKGPVPLHSEYGQLHPPCTCWAWWWKGRGSSRSIVCALTAVLTSVDGVEVIVLQTWNGRRRAQNWSHNYRDIQPTSTAHY